MSLYVKYISSKESTSEKMQISSDSGQFGDPASLKAGFSDTPWATLEPQGWPLDGTRDILPDSPDNIGWWSKEASGDDGVFPSDNRPIFQLVFPRDEAFSAPGITFQFWPSTGEWCNDISIVWYYNDEELGSETAQPDSANWFFDHSIDGFNKIEVEFISTNIPGHFAKLQRIQIGQEIIFFRDELVRVSLLNEVDPSGCELSADELTVEIRDSKNRKLNIQKDHRLQLFQNDKIAASHYIKNYTREGEDRYILKAQSAISVLEDAFLGGFYENKLASNVLSEIFDNELSWDLDLSLREKAISGYLPVCTKREALQQIAFAIGAYITTQGDGTIQIKKVSNPNSNKPETGIDKNNIFQGSNLNLIRGLKEINVISHYYGKSEEIETLRDISIEPLSFSATAVFPQPYWDYDCDQITNHGEIFEIEKHANWIRLDGEPGTYRISGKKYVHSPKDNIWQNPDNPEGDTIKVENATLITDDNVQEVIERLKAYYSLENSLNSTVVVDNQKAGDVVEIANPFGESLTVGYITKMESEFTANGHTASIEVRGTERPREYAEVLK